MRSFFIVVISLLFTVNSIHAQSPEDSSGYNPGICMLDKAKTLDDYFSCANYFEQLGMRYINQWLTSYFTGLCYIHASYQARGNVARDSILDKAQQWIDKAFMAKPGDPEIHVLQAFLYQARLQVNPQLRGLTYSQKANDSLKKAIAADPGNPRAYMLMGYNTYYTPVAFGGGAKKALPDFLKAKEKYRSFKPLLPFYPGWGETDNRQMIKMCNQPVN